MKKSILVTLPLVLSVSLLGCSNKDAVQEVSEDSYKRTFIIIDSVNEPLPPEAENVEYMPSGIGGPQLIPNAKFSDPIILTKMSNRETKGEENTSSNQK